MDDLVANNEPREGNSSGTEFFSNQKSGSTLAATSQLRLRVRDRQQNATSFDFKRNEAPLNSHAVVFFPRVYIKIRSISQQIKHTKHSRINHTKNTSPGVGGGISGLPSLLEPSGADPLEHAARFEAGVRVHLLR